MTRRFLLSCCLALFILVGCQPKAIEINVKFDDLSGLAKGDRVLFDANEAGSVSSLRYNDDRTYLVKLSVDRGFAHALTEHSRFYVVDDTAMAGRNAIEIQLSRQGGVPLKSGATVQGSTKLSDLADRLQKDVESGYRFFKETLEAWERDLQQVPESEAFQNLKKSLEALADEIRQKEKEAREKIKREWLPKIERELDDLRRRLEKQGREDELKPLEIEMERLRRI